MSWRATDEWPDGLIVPNPKEVAGTLEEAARPTGHRSLGEGRRMRKLGRTLVALAQVALLAFMVLVPAGTFAGKPAADPAASTTQVESGKGKSAEAKAKKGSTDTETAPTTDAKPGKGNGGAEKAPPKKGSGSETKGKSSEKGKSGEKGAQGQGKKAEAAAAETTVAAASGEPTITSDKPDYPPGGKVVLTGTNWQGDEPSGVRIVVNDDAGKTWSRGVIVDVANDGTIKDQFRLPDWFVAVYTVTATGLDTGRVATTSFTDMSLGTYDQCSNDDGDGYTSAPVGCHWTNGNLQGNNSTYQEGDATVQRLWLTDLVPGTEYTITLAYGTTKGGKHAYDYLTTWNYSESWISDANLCQDVDANGNPPGGSCTLWGADDLLAIPDDPNPEFDDGGPNGIPVPQPGGRFFTMRNGDMTEATDPEMVSGDYTGDSQTNIDITFTAGNDPDACVTKSGTTTCSVILWFGAHVALTSEWATGGAGNVSGSPYHVAFEAFDGDSSGRRDNQMAATAIVPSGSITIIKDTVPNGGQNFAYVDSIPDCVIGPLDDDADATLSDRTECLNVVPGSYTVTETLPVTGYDLTNIVCTGDPGIQIGTDADFDTGDTGVTIDLDSAEAVVCTFTNTARGSITIIKDTVPNGGQNFAYVDSIPDCVIGPLDDDADATLSDRTECLNVVPGSYTVTETLPVTGYDLTNIVCTGDPGIQIGTDADFDTGDTGVTIDLDSAEAVVCTFTNTARGSITIIKDTVPNGGQNFAYVDSIPDCVIGPLDDDADATLSDRTECLNVVPGSYTVTETLPVTGYDLTNIVCTGDPGIQIGTDADFDTGDTGVTIDLDSAEAVVCTFTNTARGSITIIKDTVPNGGQNFAYVDSIPDCVIGPLDDDADATLSDRTECLNVVPGSYTVTETLPVTGYDLTNIVCTGDPGIQIGTDADFDTGDTGVTIDLDSAEAVVCTFTNTARGSITIIKDTVPNGGQNFAYVDSIPDCVIGPLDDDADATLSDRTECLNVVPGSYTVTETLPVTGYDLTNIVCTGDPGIQIGTDADFDTGDTGVTIDLDSAEAVVCTFTNTARGSITIIKDTVPNGGQNFAYVDSIPDCVIGPLDDDADATLSDRTECLNVVPGSYTVTETLPVTGYDLTNIVCTGDPGIQIGTDADFDTGDTGVTIDLDSAEAVVCTFTNTARGSITIIKDTVPNGGQNFAYVDSIPDCVIGPLDDDADATLSDRTECLNVVPGSYTVTETLPVTGYDLTNIVCTGDPGIQIGTDADFDTGDTGVTIDLDSAEAVVCTFTNTARGSITIIKDTVPNGGQNFAYVDSIPDCVIGPLDDDADATLSDRTECLNVVPGSYTVTETLPVTGYDLTNIVCTGDPGIQIGTDADFDTGDTGVTIDLDSAEAVVCTFTNTARGKVKVIKTISGVTPPAGTTDTFTFEIRSGATADTVVNNVVVPGAPGTLLESGTASEGSGWIIEFTTFLLPNTTYQLCELVMPGWSTNLGPNPFNLTIGGDNVRVCTNFTVDPGETKTFTVDNTPPPGGEARTIGFWKNWNECSRSKGKQSAELEAALDTANSLTIGDLIVTDSDPNACEILVDLLDKRDYKAAALVGDGQKKASDPAFNFTAQYVAYLLNIAAGAGTCSAATTAATGGQTILAAIDFDGSSADGDATHLAISAANAALLNQYAATLDLYNNNSLCP